MIIYRRTLSVMFAESQLFRVVASFKFILFHSSLVSLSLMEIRELLEKWGSAAKAGYYLNGQIHLDLWDLWMCLFFDMHDPGNKF